MDQFEFIEDYCIGTCDNSGIQYKFDIEDYDAIKEHHWWSQKNGILAFIDNETVSLAKFILGIKTKGTKVRKKNGDTYDFRKSNLFYGNVFSCTGDILEVECFDGRKFIVSLSSYETVSKYVWHIDSNNYVITKTKNGRVIKLHRLLLGVVDDKTVEVDHINRNTLDNRVENLRIADRSLNSFNRDLQKYNNSGTIGVYKMTGYDKWCAQINAGGQRYYLGSFDKYDDAVAARKVAESNFYNI